MPAIVGTSAPDAIADTAGDDSIQGLGGNDTVTHTGGYDTVDGGAGDDTLVIDSRGLTGDLEIGAGARDGTRSPDGGGGVTRLFPDETFEGISGYQYRSIEHFRFIDGDASAAILGPNPGVRPFFADTISAGGGDDFVGLGFSRSVIDLGTGYNGATLDRGNATNDMTFDMPLGTYSGVEGLYGSLNYVETLKTGSGNDSIITGVIAGNLFAEQFINTQIIYAGAGDDTVVSSGDDILAYGGDGTDTLVVDASASRYGIQSSPPLSADDLGVVSGRGTYTEFQGFENEQLTGGAGANLLRGGARDDTLTGGASADTLDGGAGADVMTGGSGSDAYYVDNPYDQVVEQANGGTLDAVHTTLSAYFAPANVEAVYYDGTGVFYGGAGRGHAVYADDASQATLIGSGGGGALYGGAGGDTLQERANNSGDRLYGGGGNDHFIVNAGDGHPTISGGAGVDTLTYTALTAADLVVDLTKVGFQAIGDGTVLQQIEILHFAGGDGNDFERGGAYSDVLKGGAGDDILIGGDGADTLDGNGGRDTLTGGVGADTFRFYGTLAGSDDTITDFQSGVDHVALSRALISPSAQGPYGFDVVSASSGPTEARPTLIVDPAAHTLSFDPDGTGTGAGVLLAHGDFTTNPGDYVIF